MPFEKGKSGNPNGRPSGTPNAVNRDLREVVQNLLESQYEQILTDLEALEPKDRVNAWIRLLDFAVPKLQRTENVIDLSKLTDEQIDNLFAKVLKKAPEYE
jgi:vacuolar-type H+-ATPase subunit E/Vma4